MSHDRSLLGSNEAFGMSDTIDPAERFKSIAALAASPPITKGEVISALQGVTDETARTQAVADLVAKKTPLTSTTATPLAQNAVQAGKKDGGGDDDGKTADTLLGSLSTLGGDSLQLSDPVMLWPAARLVFAIGLSLISAGAAGVIANRNQTSDAFNIPLAVVSVGALVIALILVMGYKNVTITKGNASSGKTDGAADSGSTAS
jgi:hypothetical protein